MIWFFGNRDGDEARERARDEKKVNVTIIIFFLKLALSDTCSADYVSRLLSRCCHVLDSHSLCCHLALSLA